MGTKMLRGISAGRDSGDAGSGKDRHPVVPPLDLSQGGTEVYRGKAEVWQQ